MLSVATEKRIHGQETSQNGLQTRSSPRVDRFGDPLPAGAIARLGTTRLQALQRSSLAITPDGKAIALPNADGTASVWNVPSGRELWRLGDAKDGSWCVAFSPDGKILAVGGTIGVRLWNLTNGGEIRTLNHSGVFSIAFSPDGKTVASGCYRHEIRIWRLDEDKAPLKLVGQGMKIGSLSFSNDGSMLASGGWVDSGPPTYANICLWNPHTGKMVKRWSNEPSLCVNSLSFSRDGKMLASADNGWCRIWDAGTSKIIAESKTDVGGAAVFTPDRDLLAVGGSSEFSVQLLDPKTGKPTIRFVKSDFHTEHIAFSRNGKIIALAGRGGISVFKADTKEDLLNSPNLDFGVRSLAFNKRGERLISLHDGLGHVRSWKTVGGSELSEAKLLSKEIFRQACFSANGEILASLTGDAQLSLFDFKVGKRLAEFTNPSSTYRMALSADAKLLASDGSSGHITLHDLSNPKQILEIKLKDAGKAEAVHHLTFSPNSKVLAAVVSPSLAKSAVSIQIWDATGVSKAIFDCDTFACSCVALSPDGSLLAIAGHSASTKTAVIAIWDLHRRRKVYELFSQENCPVGANAMAFSPDGSQLLSEGKERSVRIWDMFTGECLVEVSAHRQGITCFAWSNDGRMFASGSTDCTTLVWDALLRDITPSEVKPLKDSDLECHWLELGNVRTAHKGMAALASAPEQSIPFLKRKINILTALSAEEIAQRIRDLDSDMFSVRNKAFKDLSLRRHEIEADLRDALANRPSAEAQRRLTLMLSDITRYPAPKDKIQVLRAIQILELVGTPEAADLLRGVSRGDARARETREANESLRRLAKRGAR